MYNRAHTGRVAKKVLSRDTGSWLLCCFDDCERQGLELHKAVVNDGYEPIYDPRTGHTVYVPKTITYVFCSNGHKMLWVDSAGPGGLQGTYRSGNRSSARYI